MKHVDTEKCVHFMNAAKKLINSLNKLSVYSEKPVLNITLALHNTQDNTVPIFLSLFV
jgi:hypothetical protein